MWSRIRHRRLQALSLFVLAGLLATSVCLGPLYHRAMQQALAGSVIAHASPADRAVRLSSVERSATDLEGLLPDDVAPYVEDPVVSRDVPVSVELPTGTSSIATRLHAVDGACQHLEVVTGSCPDTSGEVMVTTEDAELNGWTVASRVPFAERLDPELFEEMGEGELTVVGIYQPPEDGEWLDAPLTGRAGTAIPDTGVATDDWVTTPETMTTTPPVPWQQIFSSVLWLMDEDAVDHDALLRIGPRLDRVRQDALDSFGSFTFVAATDLPEMAERVATGSEQGRTTVVVLVAQLLVLVVVVLWMVLVAATEDRRAELALARLRGRGRRGAAAYLLAELLPLSLGGVAAGVLAAPFVMGLVALVVFPVPVPVETPDGYLLAALLAAVAVLAVVLAAAQRAVGEPVDSLLRAVRARHAGRGAGVGEVAVTVFSLTAVAALLTGNLEGPLATLAPTLLAVAVGLLLGRAIAPATRSLSRWLLRRGHAVAAVGIITAVRRPAARRILVMVLVATSLLAFCVDAMMTGQHNRQNAAEQLNGAPYSLSLPPSTRLVDVLSAVEAADPDHRHVTPVVTTTNTGSRTAATVAVDSVAFSRVAYFPLSHPGRGDWAAIRPPSVDPVLLTGATLTGTTVSDHVHLTGPAKERVDEPRLSLVVRDPDGRSLKTELSGIAIRKGTVAFSVPLPCAGGCIVTGVAVSVPIGGRLVGTVVLRDLTVDGRVFSLGPPTGWRRTLEDGSSLAPVADAAGDLGLEVSAEVSEPPAMVSIWVPAPVPGLTSGDETGVVTAPGPTGQLDLWAVGTLPRVPGSPPGARVVDLDGVLRGPARFQGNLDVEVWADDRAALERATSELRRRGATPGEVTTVGDVRADLDAAPAAWSLALSVLVGLVALLVAVLVMLIATATTWRTRATDLAALRMTGLPSRALRRMELLGGLPVVLLGSLAGVCCGVVAGVVALPGVRQFTDPPAVDTTDFSTPWGPVVLATALGAALLAILAVVASRWTARRASLSRLREVA